MGRRSRRHAGTGQVLSMEQRVVSGGRVTTSERTSSEQSERCWSGLGGSLMGARWVPLPHHAATIGEIMKVLWSDYYGAAVFGDEEEIACFPYKRCRLEIVA